MLDVLELEDNIALLTELAEDVSGIKDGTVELGGGLDVGGGRVVLLAGGLGAGSIGGIGI